MNRTIRPDAASSPRTASWLCGRRIAAAALSLGALHPISAAALGVGAAEFRSYLGEPLSVRLPVILDVSEPAGELETRLLPASAYAALGLEAPRIDPAQLDLRLIEEEGRIWLEIQSRRSMLEPLVILLLEARLGSIRIVRELALMPEPPPRTAAPVKEPAAPAVTMPAARLRVAAPAVPERPPPQAAVPAVAPSQPPQASGSDRQRHVVVAGETLRQIAERVRPEPKYGIRRVMTGLLLANPGAFDAVTGLPRVGAELLVPSRRELLDLSDETITATVGARAGAATAGRPQVPESRPQRAPPASAAAPDIVTGREPVAAPRRPSGLRLSLQLSPASLGAIAAAATEEAPTPTDPSAGEGQVEFAGTFEPASTAPVVAEAEPAVARAIEPIAEAASDAPTVLPAAANRSAWIWWFAALLGFAGLFWWQRRRAAVAAPPPKDMAVNAPMAQAPAPAPAAVRTADAASRGRPVHIRVVGGRKEPEILALEQRLARLAARPGTNQRTLTLASAYLDSGDAAMARELADELEAQVPRRGLG